MAATLAFTPSIVACAQGSVCTLPAPAGELLKLVRNLRRAVEKPTSAAGMVKELQDILAVVPTSEGGFGELEGRSSAELQRWVL